MINDSELSKGNNVLFEDIVAEILEIRETFAIINIPSNDGVYPYSGARYEQLDPIVITEDVLLQCGAKSNPYKDRYELNGFKHNLHFECNKTKGFTELWIDGFPHIKHLHRLQNLYFELNDEKLVYRY
jgi:hypothetical protein